MRRPPYFLLLSFFALNIYYNFAQTVTCPTNQFLLPSSGTCVTACPTTTYISSQEAQPTCLPQRAISATVRPIPEENSLLIFLNDTQLPFQDPNGVVEVDMLTDTGAISLNAISSFLAPDTIKVLFANPPVYKETTLQVTVGDYASDTSSPSYVIPPAAFPYLRFASPNNADPDVVGTLTRLDRGLEWAWIAVTCLNPYAYLYMNTKLYRETLDVFKRTNVRFGRDAGNFFQINNNKVSGFKAANMFPILLEDNPVSSGWNREEENSLPSSGMEAKRFNDLKLPSTESVYTYDPYALFLDNYGSQITVFFGFIALIIVFEALNILFCCNRRKNGPSKIVRLFQAVRTFLRWNILLACIIGSFQTLMYYFMVQMQVEALADGDENNNLSLNFWFAIGTMIILGFFFPLILAFKLRSIYKERKAERQSLEKHKSFGIFSEIFDFERKTAVTFIFLLMLRTPIFAALTLFLNYNPIAQVSVMLGFSVLFTILLLVIRPFKRLFHTLFQLLNELVLIAFLCILIFLAQQVEKDLVDDNEAVSSGAVLIALWLLVPTLGIVFGLIGIAMNIFRRSEARKRSEKYNVQVARRQSSQGMQIEVGQEVIESGAFKGTTEMAKVVGEVQSTEPLPILLPTTHEINELEEIPVSQEPVEAGKKGPSLQIEATPSRRVFPNLSYIEGIDTIIEDVEKEQASANLKEEGNTRRRRDNTLNNISMTKSAFDIPAAEFCKPRGIETGRKDVIRMSNPVLTGRDSLNVSRISEADPNRTQDKIKAAPLSLDMPGSLRTSRVSQEGFNRRTGSTIFSGYNNRMLSSSNGFNRMDPLNTSTNRSMLNLDMQMQPVMKPRHYDEGYKCVNKRLIFEDA